MSVFQLEEYEQIEGCRYHYGLFLVRWLYGVGIMLPQKRHTLNVDMLQRHVVVIVLCQGPKRVWRDNRKKMTFFFFLVYLWEENKTAALYLDQNVIFTILCESCPKVTDCKKSIPSSFEVGLCWKRRYTLRESNIWTARSLMKSQTQPLSCLKWEKSAIQIFWGRAPVMKQGKISMCSQRCMLS